MRSQLAPYAAQMREPDPDAAWEFARRKFHDDGVIILLPAEVEKRHGWVAARTAVNLGEQFFGKRKT